MSHFKTTYRVNVITGGAQRSTNKGTRTRNWGVRWLASDPPCIDTTRNAGLNQGGIGVGDTQLQSRMVRGVGHGCSAAFSSLLACNGIICCAGNAVHWAQQYYCYFHGTHVTAEGCLLSTA